MKPHALGLLVVAGVLACRSEEAPARGGASVQGTVQSGIVLAGGVAPPRIVVDSVNPVASDSASVAAGYRIFLAMNCDGCHSDPPTGFQGPSLTDGRWRHGGTDREVFESVYYGRPRGMPAYGGVMNADMIWNVVTYLRAQPVPANVPTESWLTSR